MSERRNAARNKSFLRGCVYFNKRRNAVDCLVRDLSATGARLIFSGSVQTPDVLDLYIPQKEQTLRAEVQWRHGVELGVIFGGGVAKVEPASGGGGEIGDRVEKLETEIAALKRLVLRLRAKVENADD